MSKLEFGSFDYVCERAALVICPLLGTQQGIEPNCYSRNVQLGSQIIFQPATCFIHIAALGMTIIMLLHVRSKYTAVGRKEIVLFFYMYMFVELLAIFLDSAVIPTAHVVYPWFAAIYAGALGSLYWCIMVNGFVGFQFAEDGTPMSLWFLRLSSLVVWGVCFFIAIGSFNGYAGLSYIKPTGLFITYLIWPVVCVVVYAVSQLLLVVRTLDDRWVIGDIIFGVAFYVVGCVILFAFSNKICNAIQHYIDGVFFFTLLMLLSVMMVYKYWDSITKEDLEFSVGSKQSVWEVKDPLLPVSVFGIQAYRAEAHFSPPSTAKHRALVADGFDVKAYDVYPLSLALAVSKGAIAASSPKEAARDVNVLALMVVNAVQVDEVLFGSGGVAEVLSPGTSIIVFSTVPPTFLASVRSRLDALNKQIGLCDSPVSGGNIRAAEGSLSIMTSGTAQSVATARPVFEALTEAPGNFSVVGDHVGVASDFKLINQVFCAIQIAASGETSALASALGISPRIFIKAIIGTTGDNFMYKHRAPWQLHDDGITKSAMTIISKDVGIVMDDARLNSQPTPMCSVAEQLFTSALGAGLQREDDGNLVKLWQRFGGKSVKEEEGNVAEQTEQGGEQDAKIKMLVAHQTAICLAATFEAFDLAVKKGMDLAGVYQVVSTGAAWSAMMVEYWPKLQNGEEGARTLPSNLIGDLKSVLGEARKLNTPLFLGAAAYQRLLS
ncbi:hypothetical protein P7C73_g4380, partial [Tremellales sp. Uapishka_1]